MTDLRVGIEPNARALTRRIEDDASASPEGRGEIFGCCGSRLEAEAGGYLGRGYCEGGGEGAH